MTPSPEFLSYDDLRPTAEKFLEEYWPSGDIPVDIEHIIDVGFGVDIVPLYQLYELVDVGGFITADASEIYVDRDVYEHDKLYHYRFTLAEELAHGYLHQDLLKSADFNSPDEWLEFQESIPENDRKWYEWQAKSFAGLILVPPEALGEKIDDAKQLAHAKGMNPIDLDHPPTREYLAEWVGRRFDVSGDVILRRGQYDGFWDEY